MLKLYKGKGAGGSMDGAPGIFPRDFGAVSACGIRGQFQPLGGSLFFHGFEQVYQQLLIRNIVCGFSRLAGY